MSFTRVGIIGTGFIGRAHLEAVRRLGNVQVTAICGSSPEKAQRQAAELFVPKAYGAWQDLIQDPEIDAVHVCTPNHLHFPIAAAAIRTGKAVMIEKPLGMNSQETAELQQLAAESGVVAGVCFHNRMFPLVQEMKALVNSDEFGEVRIAHGNYLQDWLAEEDDWNWRLEPELGGTSRALADIGSHWCDTMEFVTGKKIAMVLADTATFFPVRKKPSGSVETFSRVQTKGEMVSVSTEDYASVLFRFEDGGRGVFTVSQVSPGRRNHLYLEVSGTKQTLAWDQEVPQHLWVGARGVPAKTVYRDPSMVHDATRSYIHYPPGHEEAWHDVWKNLMMEFYRDVQAGKRGYSTYATIADGHRSTMLTDAILESAKTGTWVQVR